MKQLSQNDFDTLTSKAGIRPRTRREVRFSQQSASLTDDDWMGRELLAFTDKSGNKGVLVMDTGSELFMAAYELKSGIISSNGRAQPIICDFCRTWQTGSRSGSITLSRPGRDTSSVTFLCCADLQCSQHVRGVTSAAKTSRSQLREDMTEQDRISRLNRRIQTIAEVVGLQPLSL